MRAAIRLAVVVVLGWAAPAAVRADEPEPPSAALGVRYRLERIAVEGNRATGAGVIRARLGFRRGDVLDLDSPDLEASRYRLLATGYFAEVELSLRRGGQRGWVVLVVRVRERPTLRLRSLVAGVEDAGFYGGLDVQDLNFLGLGRSLGAAFVASEAQQAFRLRWLDPAILGHRTHLHAIALYNHARERFGAPEAFSPSCPDPDASCRAVAIEYERAGATVGIGTAIARDVRLHLRTRAELLHVDDLPVTLATRRRGIVRPLSIDLHPGNSVLTTLALGLELDTRSDPFMPSRGARLWAEAEVSSIATASDFEYARLTAGVEQYFRLPWKHVFKVDLFAGLVVGDAPFFDQFYVGDLSALVPDRILDLSFESRGSPNFLGTVVGEMRYEPLAARAAIEYVVPLHRAEQLVYKIDFFSGAGVYLLGALRDFRLARSGYEGLARAPLDLTFDVGFRVDTEVGIFVLSISNLTALVPFRGAPP